MSVIGSNILAGASGQGGVYNLTNSLRFRSSASAYLNRTFSTPTSRRIFTTSFWIKRGEFAGDSIYGRGTGPESYIAWSSNSLEFYDYTAPSYNFRLVTSQVFRDPAAWYHIVVAVDTTQATNTNRIKIYVNGSQVTAFSTANYPAQNFDSNLNTNSTVNIGRADFGDYLDGYLTEFNFIDGQQLTPSSFGETSATTGVWIPKKFSGTYGTNGFYLPFTNTSSTSTLGNDFSGNSNTWTVNNISLTAGSTYDSMTDVPTLTNITTANYCVLSPVDTYDNPPTEGNLRRTGVGHTGSPWSTCRATLGVSSGKWYFEGTLTGSTGSVGNNMIGVMTTTTSTLSDAYGGSTTRSYQANGNLQGDNSTGTVSSATSGDVIMIAFDVDAGKLWVGKNGTWMNSGVPASGTGNVFTTLPTSPIVPQVSMYGNTGDNYGWFTNFGQRPFAYTPPTGFNRLNTFNLPTPTIGATAATLANEYFDATTYTGNGSSQLISNAGSFQPNFVWIKERSAANQHNLMDVLRTGLRLRTDDTAADSDSSTLFSFASTGFNVLTSNASYNGSAKTYVAWQWKASDSGVSNTAGSITSTVSANTSAGFSIVTYTGNATAGATVGHGLGVAPSMIIVKRRNDVVGWFVWHTGYNSATAKMDLNSSDAIFSSNVYLNSTYPTSTLVTLGTSGYTNASGGTYVMYAFAQVAGYSAFGSYTGNGSSDGPFVFTGFKPRYVMIKRSDSTADWNVRDTARSPYNVVGEALYPNLSLAEYSGSETYLDILSNGFKLRGNWNSSNASGGTYIYMAFAENPFKYSNAR